MSEMNPTGSPSPESAARPTACASEPTARAARPTACADEGLSTGQLAELCGTTVRTVQYYDECGLLAPVRRSEGNRRRYATESVERLREILFLKGLGLSLSSIRELLAADAAPDLIERVLVAQDERLAAEVAEHQRARDTIAYLLESLRSSGRLPALDQTDMAAIMDARHQLTHARIVMFVAVAAFVGLSAALGAGDETGWLAAALGVAPEVAHTATGVLISAVTLGFVAWTMWYYRRNVAFECPCCHEVFQAGYGRIFIAPHTPTTRKLTCPACGRKSWCVEVGSSRAA